MSEILVYGHLKIQENLLKEVKNKTFSHAYLFYGPEHIGKKTLTLRFTQILFCKEKKSPCGKCQACKQVSSCSHPDLFLISPEEGKKNITIEQIRNLQKNFLLKPFSSEYKIAIIDQAESLNKEASNALLKLLEEPPVFSIIFLISSSPNKLLPTVISRLRKVRFSALGKEEIIAVIKNFEVDENKKEALLNLSDGKIGWVLDALKNNELIDEINEYTSLFNKLLNAPLHERLSLLEPFHKNSSGLDSFLYYLLLWWRDITFILLGKNELLHFSFEQDFANKLKLLSKNSSTLFLNFLSDIIDDQQYNLNKRLLLENLAIQMPLLTRV